MKTLCKPLILVACLAYSVHSYAQLTLQSSTPTTNSTGIAQNSDLVFSFSEAIDGATLNSTNLIISGSHTGIILGSFSGGGTTTVTFNPTHDFEPGEVITATLTTNLASTVPNNLTSDVTLQWTVATVTQSIHTFVDTNITMGADGPVSVFSVDIDGDGDQDVLSASSLDSSIYWYENDGIGNFTTHNIANNVSNTFSVYGSDIDSDGDMDVLATSITDNSVIWFENDGSESFISHTIASNVTTAVYAYPIDLDGDGDMDIISAALFGNEIIWHENDGNENFTSTSIASGSTLTEVTTITAVDMDNDGDLDIVSAASGTADRIAWHENNGSESFTTHDIMTGADGANFVYTVDLDGDGDVDVVSSALNDNSIYWHENDGNEIFITHTITASADGARSVHVSDLDGDGDMDVLSASQYDDTIAWHENDGTQMFTTHVVTDLADGAHSVYVADIDGDQLLDVLSADAVGDQVVWYKNTLPAVELQLSVFLQGPYDSGSGLMNDDLRSSSLIPTSTPYTDAAVTNAAVFNVTGNDAIVDWVFVELRDKNDISTVLYSSSALLQRDGDVVALDGVSDLSIDASSDDYYVSVSHRNHIPVATDAVVSLSTTASAVDLTMVSNVRGTTNAVIEVTTGVYALFAGDVDGNSQVQTTDYSTAANLVGQSGYFASDANMNGQIQTTDLSLLIAALIGSGIQF